MLARAAKCKDLSSVTVGATVPVPDLDDDVYRLNFESERTISEDFAFLTANEDGPTRVSAASLLATRQVASSVISIACNQGVHPNVRHAVGEVVAVVRAVADLPFVVNLNFVEQADRLLSVILNVHRNRILGRLGSSRYKVPEGCYADTTRTLLGDGLRPISMLIESAARPHSAEMARSEEDINAFLRCAKKLDGHDKGSNTISSYKNAIKAAYALTLDGVSLQKRLRRLGLPMLPTSSKELRHLPALANYWRICLHLTRMARTYRKAFRHLQANFVSYGSREHTVHAEIQLLVYHETSAHALRPRIISASKKPCFLCHTFINAYGWYAGQETHGKIYPNWNIPAATQFPLDVRRQIEYASEHTARVVANTIRVLKERAGAISWPPDQAQSVINLNLTIIPSAAPSTIIDAVASVADIKSEHMKNQDASPPSIKEDLNLARAVSGVAVPPPNDQEQDPVETTENATNLSIFDARLADIQPTDQASVAAGAVQQTSIPSSTHSSGMKHLFQYGPDVLEIEHGTYEVLDMLSKEAADGIVNLGRLESVEEGGKELTFKRPDGAGALILQLQHSGFADVKIRLHWDSQGRA
ncbi:hypothetical protein CLAFUW4_06817 [Fulvia fulva]|uniref:Uncharacterized protein n=1 Tax=Passalora fulva TaxID=5499 RepID=A0A9Q8UR33_PASFU|nr:uncharacterized protein CLAFUR5_06954 [Fulvia fulva]KAK4621627.1 hypothetical protein CLAFUR4_06825 [Fulvia fulva]KAK4622679.1 hypothetical protein CLAFUR0_06820 [Fulvia fulva]UJO19301.1 hypothetical protein CLAFUR5_06954 [Fulvia fulva]WPV15930.1 hypothetical protein CLAFUW4_06817 [Fulvia fulva]WPV31220.1 hypothetical protein CLAFUW7_06816 [Fulvia fulva]